MGDFPWLTVLVLIPLLGGAGVALLPRGFAKVREVALGVSLLTLVVGGGRDSHEAPQDQVWQRGDLPSQLR